MSRRITVMTPDMSDVEERPFDSWLPGQGLLQESIALALIIMVAGEVIIFGLAYPLLPPVEVLSLTLDLFPLVAALAALIALVLAVYRVLRYERREKRHLEMMDLQVEHLRRQVYPDGDEGVPPVAGQPATHDVVSDGRRWNRIAYEMLRRYYGTLRRTGSREAAARAMSRDVMVQAGVCTQREWNIVNQLLIRRGIRHGRKRFLRAATFDEAWGIWRRAQANPPGWYVTDDGYWVPKE